MTRIGEIIPTRLGDDCDKDMQSAINEVNRRG